MRMFSVKVLGVTTDQLLAQGLGVNTYDCQPGERVAVHTNKDQLLNIVEKNQFTTIGEVNSL